MVATRRLNNISNPGLLDDLALQRLGEQLAQGRVDRRTPLHPVGKILHITGLHLRRERSPGKGIRDLARLRQPQQQHHYQNGGCREENIFFCPSSCSHIS